MSRVITSGVTDNKGVTILKQPEQGVNTLRCPTCQCLALPSKGPDGRTVYSCTGCQKKFKSIKM